MDFFLQHHTDEKIIDDIKAGKVYILQLDNDEYVGTVTVDGMKYEFTNASAYGQTICVSSVKVSD